jgi:hypothetical protein
MQLWHDHYPPKTKTASSATNFCLDAHVVQLERMEGPMDDREIDKILERQRIRDERFRHHIEL